MYNGEPAGVHAARQGSPGDRLIRTVINKTRRSVKVALPRGKTLYLGPGGRGQVHDDTLERPAFKKMVEAGDLEVLEADGSPPADSGGGAPGLHPSEHGHPSTRNVARKGDR